MLDLEGYNGFEIKSPKMYEVFEAVHDFARQGQPLIMFGPSGVGKEFLARYYFAQYSLATHCKGRFISLNCAGISEALAMSDLFGHVKGSFTSADRNREGLLKMAQDGVLFLDEIGDLADSVQAMLLRAMDENTHEGRKLGDDKNYSIQNTLIICATEKSKDNLRESLLFRSGLQIQVPGLDDRPEDVEDAIKFFCTRAIEKRLDRTELLSMLLKRNEGEISKDTLSDPQIIELVHDIARHLTPLVKARDWPGNFRALRTAVDSGIIRAKKMNSSLEFIEDVKKYFHHHLGDYSISVIENLHPVHKHASAEDSSGISEWMDTLAREIPNLKDDEKAKLSSFLSDYKNTSFKRKDFELYMGNLSQRVSQNRIKELIENNILERDANARFRYRIKSRYDESDGQDIKLPILMKLPESHGEEAFPEKALEAIGIIENSQGLFISEDDSHKRETFLASLGNALIADHDVLYYSFCENSLQDFVVACIDHLSKLDLDGWFKKEDWRNMIIEEKIFGLSGYINQILLKHKKTIIILDALDLFKTIELQSIIDKLIFYWHPVQFIFGTKKQFFQQHYSNSPEFMELKL